MDGVLACSSDVFMRRGFQGRVVTAGITVRPESEALLLLTSTMCHLAPASRSFTKGER